MSQKTYLGDGVYAEFDNCVLGALILPTENGIRVTNTIYFEPEVLYALLGCIGRLRKYVEEAAS